MEAEAEEDADVIEQFLRFGNFLNCSNAREGTVPELRSQDA